MKNILMKKLVIIFTIWVSFMGIAFAQTNRKVQEAVSYLESPNWKYRYKGILLFNSNLELLDNEEAKEAIINLLVKEGKHIDLKGGGIWGDEIVADTDKDEDIGEGQANYLYELSKIAVKSKDNRVIRSLVKVGFIEEVSVFGSDAIEDVLQELETENITRQNRAIVALTNIITSKSGGDIPNQDIKNKVKKKVLKKIDNKFLKMSIVYFLGELAFCGDKDVVPIIEKMANEDPYFQDFSKKKNYTGPKIRYPVREEAQKVLGKLKKEGKIKE